MDDKFWFLKNCDLFEQLKPDEITRLEGRSRSRAFDRGSLIYLPSDQSDSLLLLGTGRVKIYHNTADGKQALLTIIEPGELFGELAIVQRGERNEFAETMEKSTVILIPREEIQRLMEVHQNVSLGVTKLMGVRLERVERRLKSLLFRSNRERVVHLLLELAERYGSPCSEGVLLEIKLAHQDLANIIGSTRESVTLVLNELQDEGNLLMKRRQYVLTRIGRLADSIGAPVPTLKERKVLSVQPLRQPQLGS